MKEPQKDLTDPFTGEVFTPRARNHYEVNDGVPHAPPVPGARRPTIRERIENLTRQGRDPLAFYVGTEGIDMDVPDDPEAPLTASEQNYIDTLASDLAESAPLPDEGLPRPDPEPAKSSNIGQPLSSGAPEAAPAASGGRPEATPGDVQKK